jgi:hypothetical protein
MLISKMLGATMVSGAPDTQALTPRGRPTVGRADCSEAHEPLDPRRKMLDRDRARGYISRHIPRANS